MTNWIGCVEMAGIFLALAMILREVRRIASRPQSAPGPVIVEPPPAHSPVPPKYPVDTGAWKVTDDSGIRWVRKGSQAWHCACSAAGAEVDAHKREITIRSNG